MYTIYFQHHTIIENWDGRELGENVIKGDEDVYIVTCVKKVVSV